MSKLKPCPLCGKDVAILSNLQDCEICSNFEAEICPAYESVENIDDCPHFVVCNAQKGGCGASTGWYSNERDAIEAWNRRAKDERLDKADG